MKISVQDNILRKNEVLDRTDCNHVRNLLSLSSEGGFC
jgi:hypothetical protein